MTNFSIVHEFATAPETFWQLFFDDAYNDAFYGSVGLTRRVLERNESADSLVIVAEFASERQLPGFVRKLLGGRTMGFVETLTFHKRDRVAEQLVEPSLMKDRIDFRGQVSIEPLGAGRVRRTYSGSIDVAVPIVGGRIERATVGDMQRTHEQAADVTRAWLAQAA